LDIKFSANCYITAHMQDITNNSYFKRDHHVEKNYQWHCLVYVTRSGFVCLL